MIYHVTCSTDDNYLQHCMAMLCSLFENNREHEFCVHMLVSSLSQEGRTLISDLGTRYHNQIVFYDIDDSMVEGVKMNTGARFNGKQMYSIATYYRIFLPSLLPETIDRILYLDCDIIVLSDVKELYDLYLDGYGLAAVKDFSPYDNYHRNKMGLSMRHSAFCAGMMMINLDYWRRTNAQEALLEYSTRDWEHVYLQDQDALNFVFRDSWFMLPYKWGKTQLVVAPIDKIQRSFDIYEFAEKPCIIHYAGHIKPWYNVWFEERNYYWLYVRKSGFKHPVVTKLSKSLYLKMHILVLRCMINKYLRPCIPDILEIILKDILNILIFLSSCIQGPRKLRCFIIERWKEKYGL